MKIRIISTPPGEAPEHVRQAWIGLEIPVPNRFAGRRQIFGVGVLSGPKNWLGYLFAIMFGRAQKEVGYIVESQVAINLLAAHSPEAAGWWRQHTPRLIKPGHFFLFAFDSCEEVHETAAS